MRLSRRGAIHAGRQHAAAGGYAAEVLADNPTSYWRFDETSGSTATDEQAAHDGTIFGATLGAAGLITDGTAFTFDGTDDYVTFGDSADFEQDTFTFEAWVKHSDSSAGTLNVIVDKTGISGTNDQWAIFWDNRSSTQRLRFFARLGGVSKACDWVGTDVVTALAAGGHLACTYDGTSMVLYWNGDVKTTIGATGSFGANTIPLTVGATGNSQAFPWYGQIDEPAYYPTELSAARVQAHYDAGVA